MIRNNKILQASLLIFFFAFLLFGAVLINGTYCISNDFKEMKVQESVESPLNKYLLELSQTPELNENSFSELEKLVFDGNVSINANSIDKIIGLDIYSFPKISCIEIKNMQALKNVDFSTTKLSPLFPNLDTLIISNCDILTNISLDTKSTFKNLTIENCESINIEPQKIFLESLENIALKNIGGNDFNIDYIFKNLLTAEFSGVSKLNSFNIRADKLNSLTIENNINLKNVILDASSLHTLSMKKNFELDALDLTKTKKLKTLNLDEKDFNEDGYIVHRKLFLAPKLTKLFISNNSHIEKIDISKSPNIETIVINNCGKMSELSLAKELNTLQTLNLNNCFIMSKVYFSSAKNLQMLSIENCNLIHNSAYVDLNNFEFLQYLNLKGTNLSTLTLMDLKNLEILILGSQLENVQLENFENLYRLDLTDLEKLLNISISNAPKLNEISFANCDHLNSITLINVGLIEFRLSGKNFLDAIKLVSPIIESIILLDCKNINKFDFSQCVNLRDIEILGCNSLNSEVMDNFESLDNLNKIHISECKTIFNFTLVDKPTITLIDIGNLNNLSILKLVRLAPNVNIILPSECASIRSMTLINMPNANFNGTNILNCSSGALSAIIINNVPLKEINICNNLISNINLNVPTLIKLNMANNRVSNLTNLLDIINNCPLLSMLNIHNNRFDFSGGAELEFIKNHNIYNSIDIGIQNVIDNNEYTYKPNIYYGGFSMYNFNISAVIYKFSGKYTKANITPNMLNKANRTYLTFDSYNEYKKGAYYIDFIKVGDDGNIQPMNNAEREIFQPLFFTVTKEFNFIEFIWIIFVVIAGAIFLYVGISYYFERKRKISMLSEELGQLDKNRDGIISAKESFDANREARKAYKENQKLIKDSDKLNKKEKKEKVKLSKEERKEQKKLLKEEKENNAIAMKFQKISDKQKEKEAKEVLRKQKKKNKGTNIISSQNQISGNDFEYDYIDDGQLPSDDLKKNLAKNKLSISSNENRELKKLDKMDRKADRLRERDEERLLMGKKVKVRKPKKDKHKFDFDVDFDNDIEDDFDAVDDSYLDEIINSRNKRKAQLDAVDKGITDKKPTNKAQSTKEQSNKTSKNIENQSNNAEKVETKKPKPSKK